MSEWGPQSFPSSLVQLWLYDEVDVKNFCQLSHLFPSSLTKLNIVNFDKLESLSKGLQHLTSLQHLTIWYCPKLIHLPKQLLPKLLSLEIYGCPKLDKRCEGRGSHYYPLISHIPKIEDGPGDEDSDEDKSPDIRLAQSVAIETGVIKDSLRVGMATVTRDLDDVTFVNDLQRIYTNGKGHGLAEMVTELKEDKEDNILKDGESMVLAKQFWCAANENRNRRNIRHVPKVSYYRTDAKFQPKNSLTVMGILLFSFESELLNLSLSRNLYPKVMFPFDNKRKGRREVCPPHKNPCVRFDTVVQFLTDKCPDDIGLEQLVVLETSVIKDHPRVGMTTRDLDDVTSVNVHHRIDTNGSKISNLKQNGLVITVSPISKELIKIEEGPRYLGGFCPFDLTRDDYAKPN
ncbi:hypothetical protein M8C21_009185 [Ambrosia artemisiifolia]|uniref:Uncharacterized protein n=1 Tax=Ambrosia artemisiifolia TaxID=4212 RepID=A0AAD5BYQ6_AMBAR|nr:hypothetical protein M8C21_009185 [Ambrosia artemisiifolia]